MTFETDAQHLMGLRHPIIQGPFGGGLSTTRLVATVSQAGGLGSYGAHVLTPDRIIALAGELRGLTDGPFALNLWISDHDPGGRDLSAAEVERWSARFAPYFEILELPMPTTPARYHQRYEDQVEAILEARPPVFSFVFGVPAPNVIQACKQRGIVTLGAATSIAEAKLLEAAGVDAIVATGFEAGGHRPSFLAPAEDSLMGTLALTQLVADRVTVPVIAAGGIADGRGVRAALTLGAQAAQLGTAFLACADSGIGEAHRDALFSDRAEDTVLTRGYSGRLARGLRNRWTEEMASLPDAIAPFPVQGWFVSQLKAAAIAAGRTDLTALYGGQIAPNLKHRSASALMDALVQDLAERPTEALSVS